MNATTLVLGGTGKTGSRLIDRLTARGVDVRVGSRSAVVPFDWEDRSTWPAALASVGAVYVAYYPDLAVPGAVDAVRALSDAAREAGVRRLVLLSGRGEEEAQQAERVVQESGLEWTVVRCAWFNQNFDESYLLEPVLSGEVALPVGDVLEPFVDADDIADVAAAALTEDGHTGRVYELTGPRLLTFADAVGEISEATGRDITFVTVPADDYLAALADEGLPPGLTWLVTYLFREVLDGRNAYLADGVRQALGREPKDFAEFARDAAARGAWER
ncbi:NAD(P)H-binding protein [Jiangella asiatica]|uniref:NmrA family transcriptional regulator n=1 Tax=Jiangella asiatica TaxID=2530372 RepID=A0A4V2Z0W8_9ACTN|nr:NAD(P)H-binding protein [Jiangella asiatica]TDE02578.1 NmrA family transcriptional regulator [Jiangella asiatica]